MTLMGLTDPLTNTLGLLSTMVRAGVIAPMRPDRYLRIASAMSRENMAITSGFAAAAARCPDRAGLVDELGILTWRQIDRRADRQVAAYGGVHRHQRAARGVRQRRTALDDAVEYRLTVFDFAEFTIRK